jgi:hypothetical protein
MEGSNQRYLLAGNTNSSIGYGSGDFFTIKVNATLAPLSGYSKVWGTATLQESMQAACLSKNITTNQSDGFILAGFKATEGLIIKTDLNLNFMWARQMGGNWSDSVRDVIQDPSDGSYILVGVTAMNSQTNLDAFFNRVSFNGTWMADRTYSLPSKPGNDTFWGVCRKTSTPTGFMFAGESLVLGDTGTSDWLLACTNTTADIDNCAFDKEGGDYFTFAIIGSSIILNKTATFTNTSRLAGLTNSTSTASVNDASFTTVNVCP